jgi:hypothetical protein
MIEDNTGRTEVGFFNHEGREGGEGESAGG